MEQMTNAELIKALRWCGSMDEQHEMCVDESYSCPMWNEDRMTDYCKADLMLAAAERRIGMSSVYSNYVKRMRMCVNGNCKGCTYQYEGLTNTEECKEDLLYDAAKQLEDADKCNARLVKKCKEMEKQIVELEARLPKEGEWVGRQKHRRCSICGFSTWYDFALDRELTSPFCPNCGARMKGEQE